MRMSSRRGSRIAKAGVRLRTRAPSPEIVGTKREALGQQGARTRELPTAQHRVDQQLHEQVALRVAAAEREQLPLSLIHI